MASNYFDFKQFRVYHDQCAMKVGTDGVLLGALVPSFLNPSRILDIGTGSGLIALMCAQKYNQAKIAAIELDENAAKQASENFLQSRWANRLLLHHVDFNEFESEVQFDLIVSNPPFFAPDKSYRVDASSRKNARYSEVLSHEALLKKTSSLLCTNGLFFVILPANISASFIALAKVYGLNQMHQIDIMMKPNAAVTRHILGFTPCEVKDILCQSMVVYDADGNRSNAYANACLEFYL